ncbi:MAG: response regulator [Anaerolineae bacterium]
MSNIRRDILRDWNVLVVEDEPDSLEVATRVLRFYGANVLAANNGKQALEKLREERPHFVISDLSMPVLDGWGLMRELKKDSRLMDIPVIALTAHALPGDRDRALEAGFRNYLTKPLTTATFMNQLLALLLEIPVLAVQLQFS